MTDFKEKYLNPFTDYGFKRLFETAEISKLSRDEYQNYENSLKYYRDLKNSLDTAKEEGKKEEKYEIASKMLKKGMDTNIIMEFTGLTKSEILKLKEK